MIRIFNLILISVIAIYFFSCSGKSNIEVKSENTISFSKKVLPIFETKCSNINCHGENGTAPILLKDSAYNSLRTGQYLNTRNPKASVIYSYLEDPYGTHIEYASDTEKKTILMWVKAGARNDADIQKTTRNKKPYDFLSVSIVCLILYALTYILSHNKIITYTPFYVKRKTHTKIWNYALLIAFLVSGLLGLLLVIKINYDIPIPYLKETYLLHVDFGIAMAIISIFHTLSHWSYFFKPQINIKKMNTKKVKTQHLSILLLVILMVSCENKHVEIERTITPKNTKDSVVSFSKDVMPVFNLSCNLMGCHGQGDYDPVLSYGEAHKNLVVTFPSKYVDTASPSSSTFYLKLTEQGSSHLGRASIQQKKIILDWIKQGAKNN